MMRLDAESAWFLYLQQPEDPMTVMSVAFLAPGEDGPVTIGRLRAHLARRLHLVPAFRWRLVDVPFGLHHPVCVEDPSFELDYHVREVTLPGPGIADEAFERFCARLADCHLDRRRPLWQLTLVNNGVVGGDRQALVLLVHHCIMDGYAMVNALARIFSPDEDGGAVGWVPDVMPGRTRLVVDAVRDHVRSLGRLPALARSSRRVAGSARAYERQTMGALPRSKVDTPWCSLHRAVTFGRSLAWADLALADVKLVKDAAGATVNDVVLAIVAGSLRTYLQVRGDLPARPLVAHVPVGFDRPGASTRTSGNRLALIATSLATDIDDPWGRLQAIAATTSESKHRNELGHPEVMVEWLEYIPPLMAEAGIRRHKRKRREDPRRLDGNVVVSNVRGTGRPPLAMGSALVDAVYLGGPLTAGCGADILMLDYGDRLLFSIMCFAGAVDAPGELADGMRDSLSELVDIARRGVQRMAV